MAAGVVTSPSPSKAAITLFCSEQRQWPRISAMWKSLVISGGSMQAGRGKAQVESLASLRSKIRLDHRQPIASSLTTATTTLARSSEPKTEPPPPNRTYPFTPALARSYELRCPRNNALQTDD